jgi:hypothetical protein
MPIVLLWAAPAVMVSFGYYLMAIADLMDGAGALTARASATSRRPQLKVIQGGKH